MSRRYIRCILNEIERTHYIQNELQEVLHSKTMSAFDLLVAIRAKNLLLGTYEVSEGQERKTSA